MSFWELLIILVVGLLVVGPERLPEAIRNGMLWFGRLKNSVQQTRTEFEQQLGVDEIRRELHNEQIMKSLAAVEDIKKRTQEKMNEIEDALEHDIKQIEDDADLPVEDHDANNDYDDDDMDLIAEDEKSTQARQAKH